MRYVPTNEAWVDVSSVYARTPLPDLRSKISTCAVKKRFRNRTTTLIARLMKEQLLAQFVKYNHFNKICQNGVNRTAESELKCKVCLYNFELSTTS